MSKLIWQCTNCDKYLDGNPIICSHCGYTVYRPVYLESGTGKIPNPTKPTTNLTRDELLIEIQNVDTAGGVVKNEITATAMKTIMHYVDTYVQAKEREARIASVQLYMDTCENNSVDPSWESIHEFQDGQIKALADLEAEKENL